MWVVIDARICDDSLSNRVKSDEKEEKKSFPSVPLHIYNDGKSLIISTSPTNGFSYSINHCHLTDLGDNAYRIHAILYWVLLHGM